MKKEETISIAYKTNITDEIRSGTLLDEAKKEAIKRELGIDVDSKILSPMSDYVFKRIFTADEKNSKIALIDLLNSVMELESGEEITDLTVVNPQIPVDSSNRKKSIFDIRVMFKNGEQAIIEMQVNKEYDFEKRSQFLISKAYVSQPIAGLDYSALKKCYLICLTNFVMFGGSGSFVSDYRFRDKSGNDLSDDETIIFIELTKLDGIADKPIGEMTGLEMWALFIKYVQDESKKELINKIIAQKEGIRMGAGILSEISQSERERLQYESELIFELDLRTSINRAKDEGVRIGEERGVRIGEERGVKRGEEIGAKKKALESAKAALELGLNIEQAAKISGLTIEEVKKCRQISSDMYD